MTSQFSVQVHRRRESNTNELVSIDTIFLIPGHAPDTRLSSVSVMMTTLSPNVVIYDELKVSSANLLSTLVLPTALSPMTTTL